MTTWPMPTASSDAAMPERVEGREQPEADDEVGDGQRRQDQALPARPRGQPVAREP